ncbi:hypothetical protein H072_6233 [Dactylellina haptotyla CBS 200.50]|uniref:Rhodopsin domain-containing protein n=1 Tax=Dactylellina haptotyla (strain CBS 200.50) TaxID=1284197 RepID=S8BX98_DACHA|nr:hypothetical protein H072_6233 [Dactylellina haptotyla CBS 200.50]
MDRAYTLEQVSRWPPGNYVNPQLYGDYLPAVETVLLIFSSTAVILRITTRGFLLRSLGPDDLVILPAWGFAVVDSISHYKCLEYGWGRHMWDIDWRIAEDLLFWQWVSGWAFSFSVMFTKASILCFYLRFGSQKEFRIVVYCVLTFLIAWSLGLAIPLLAQCNPINSTWQFLSTTGLGGRKCISYDAYKKLSLAQGILNLCSDVILFCLPLSTVMAMKRPRKERAALIGLFSMGLLVCIFAALRLKALHKTFQGDVSWYGYELWLWVSLEVHFGIMIASLPGIRLLFITLFRKPPVFHEEEKSTLFSNPHLKMGASPAKKPGGRYFDDNLTTTTISALERNPDGGSGRTSMDTPPRVLQRLRLSPTKKQWLSPTKKQTLTVPEERPGFDFHAHHSTARNRHTTQSTLGQGADFEEIAVPPPSFGGFLVYKNTEISVTSESIEQARGGTSSSSRPKTPLSLSQISDDGEHDEVFKKGFL